MKERITVDWPESVPQENAKSFAYGVASIMYSDEMGASIAPIDVKDEFGERTVWFADGWLDDWTSFTLNFDGTRGTITAGVSDVFRRPSEPGRWVTWILIGDVCVGVVVGIVLRSFWAAIGLIVGAVGVETGIEIAIDSWQKKRQKKLDVGFWETKLLDAISQAAQDDAR